MLQSTNGKDAARRKQSRSRARLVAPRRRRSIARRPAAASISCADGSFERSTSISWPTVRRSRTCVISRSSSGPIARCSARAPRRFADGQAMPEEFVLADLQDARAALEEITGRRAPEDLLAHIFARFCIGK